jgi:glutamine cyclotransferase
MKQIKKRNILWLLSPFIVLAGGVTAYKFQRAYRQFESIRSLPVIIEPKIPSYSLKVTASYPHSRNAFTEGLEWHHGVLYESAGLRGKSTLRKIDIVTGKTIKKKNLDASCFAEGMTVFHGKIYQLTWKSQKGFIYDANTLKKTGTFSFNGQGWGLTHDSKSLIMSDGTSKLRFLDPETFNVTRVLRVRLKGREINNINDLEYVNGIIYANIYITNTLIRIDASSGEITGLIDISPLYKQMSPFSFSSINMPNGIAYNPVKKDLYVTGKFWPKLFKVKLIPGKHAGNQAFRLKNGPSHVQHGANRKIKGTAGTPN